MTSATEHAMDNEQILRVEHLSLWITTDKVDVPILDDASFSVRRGERWGIAGESGAGKSMMMSAVSALLPNGSTRIEGKILYRMEDGSWQDLMLVPPRMRHRFVSERVAFIFQDSIHALNPNERVIRQWSDTVKLHHPSVSDADCLAHLLEQMELFGIRGGEATLRSYPHQLSGGMRQRIAIAMALESQNHLGADTSRRLIIADEPTTSLDTITQRSVVDHTKHLCETRGSTLLYVSHNLGILQYLCDHLMVLKDGRIVEQGLAHDLFFNAQDPYTRKIVGETMKIMGSEGGEL